MTLPLDQWIKNYEGLRLRPYTDTTGHLTVGYGHNLSANGISLDIADLLLDSDIGQAQHELQLNMPWVLKLDPVRQNCFIHLCFWIGIGSLLAFQKMNWSAQTGDWDNAANELLQSQLHTDIPKRTEDIAQRLQTGVSP